MEGKAMIYAMREEETGLVKIGLARDHYAARRERMPAIAAARRKATGRPSTLRFLLFADWPPDAEMLIHRYLWQSWVEGEWFSDSDRLQEVLRYMRLTSDYFTFMRAFRAAQSTLPGPWYWKNRDHILRAHQAQQSAKKEPSNGII